MKIDKDELLELVYEHPANVMLGEAIRKMCKTLTIDIDGEIETIDCNRDYPNNMSLGSKIREIHNSRVTK